MQIEDIQPYEMLSALPESARRQFYDMAGFDYDCLRRCSTLPQSAT